MNRKIVRNVNDLIALLLLLVVIPALWVLTGTGAVKLPETVIGATIMGWTLVLQFYFRKSPEEPKPPTGGG